RWVIRRANELDQHRAVPQRFILAITADGDRRSFGELRQELDHPARFRALHLVPELSEEGRDGHPGFQNPQEQWPAGGQRREPDIEVVFPGIVSLADAPREEPDDPDTEPLAALTRRPGLGGVDPRQSAHAILTSTRSPISAFTSSSARPGLQNSSKRLSLLISAARVFGGASA